MLLQKKLKGTNRVVLLQVKKNKTKKKQIIQEVIKLFYWKFIEQKTRLVNSSSEIIQKINYE